MIYTVLVLKIHLHPQLATKRNKCILKTDILERMTKEKTTLI